MSDSLTWRIRIKKAEPDIVFFIPHILLLLQKCQSWSLKLVLTKIKEHEHKHKIMTEQLHDESIHIISFLLSEVFTSLHTDERTTHKQTQLLKDNICACFGPFSTNQILYAYYCLQSMLFIFLYRFPFTFSKLCFCPEVTEQQRGLFSNFGKSTAIFITAQNDRTQSYSHSTSMFVCSQQTSLFKCTLKGFKLHITKT